MEGRNEGSAGRSSRKEKNEKNLVLHVGQFTGLFRLNRSWRCLTSTVSANQFTFICLPLVSNELVHKLGAETIYLLSSPCQHFSHTRLHLLLHRHRTPTHPSTTSPSTRPHTSSTTRTRSTRPSTTTCCRCRRLLFPLYGRRALVDRLHLPQPILTKRRDITQQRSSASAAATDLDGWLLGCGGEGWGGWGAWGGWWSGWWWSGG